MVFSKRERYIGFGVGAAVALMALDSFLLKPFIDRRDAIARETADVTQKLANGRKRIKQERELKKVWAEMTSGGMKSSESEATSQALTDLREWMQLDAGAFLTTLKSDRITQEGTFQVISFRVTGTGRLRDIARMTSALEQSPIPMKIHEMQLSPAKEGTDELKVELNVSTLCMPPEADKGDKSGDKGGDKSEGKRTTSASPAGDRL